MNHALDTLCDVLDEELARQLSVREAVQGQRTAVATRDIDKLNESTRALQGLIREAVQAEAQRRCVLRQVIGHYDLPEDRQTMTELIELVPDPWKIRMRAFQTRIREIVAETRAVAGANRRALRQSLRVVNECLDALQQSDAAGPAYGARGDETAPSRNRPVVLDSKG